MNQALINELRAHVIKIQVEMHAIEKFRQEINNPTHMQETYAQLLNARSSALNGIAVLVAANKR